MNKRGADITTVMIFLVVGLVVGVLLIWGFSTNWAIFSSLFSSGSNVNIINTQCQAACSALDTYGYCSMERTLKASDLTTGNSGEVKDTCKNFATLAAYTKYKIVTCPALPCPAPN